MRNKITSAAEAVAIVQSGDAICTSGFVGIGVPDALLVALERRFVDTGEPRDLTLLFAAGQGDGKERGLNALGHEGLLKRAIGGHWGLIPKVGRRCALELRAGAIANLGIGMPEGVAAIAAEELVSDLFTLTADPGVIGGIPASGLDFGAAVNTDAIIHQNQQFDFYDGGGLDIAILGMAGG